MQKLDPNLVAELTRREPRSTIGLAAAFSAYGPNDVRVVGAGASSCVMVRYSPMIWRGYPSLVDPADAQRLAAAVEATAVVSLDGHPDDVDPLLPHMTRVGEVDRFHRMVTPAGQCGWAPSTAATRLATPLDIDALDRLFDGYEVRFLGGARWRRRHLQKCVASHGAVVHVGEMGIDGAALTGGLTPAYLVFEHLRVAPQSRGRGISWALVSKVVEIAQAYGVGLLGSIVKGNPMSIPAEQGWIELQTSVNLRLPDRVPGERRFRRLAIRLSNHLGA